MLKLRAGQKKQNAAAKVTLLGGFSGAVLPFRALVKLALAGVTLAGISLPSQPAYAQTQRSAKKVKAAAKTTTKTSSRVAPPASINALATSAVAVNVPATEAPKRFSLRADISTMSSLFQENDPSRVAQNSLGFSPSFQLTDTLSLGASGTFTQELTGEQNTTFSNVRMGLSRKAYDITPHLSFAPGASVTLPTNQIAYKTDRFQGAIGTSARLGINPKWSWPATAFYSIGFDLNSHEFTHNAFDSANIQTRLSNTLGAALPIVKSVSLSVRGTYANAWTYRGYGRERFDLTESINWNATPALSLSVSHSNAGSAAKANGRDSNIGFFNEQQSVIAAGMGYVF